ncbi:MAG: LSM domain-containing protein [Nitrosopumilaceae archaeon]|nr:LSM domain-containing protein [Nitrosopumilaceae archaeon]
MLSNYINTVVLVKLKNQKTIQGNLQNFDQLLNLTLIDSKDVTNNDIKNIGSILLRGDNIIILSLFDKLDSTNKKDY